MNDKKAELSPRKTYTNSENRFVILQMLYSITQNWEWFAEGGYFTPNPSKTKTNISSVASNEIKSAYSKSSAVKQHSKAM